MKRVMFVLLLGLCFVAQVSGGPAKEAMPNFPAIGLEQKGRFIEPCEYADSFFLHVTAFGPGSGGMYDAFTFRFEMINGPADAKPYLAMKTDGKQTFVYEWLDMDRDGFVDAKGEWTGEIGEAVEHVCATARRLVK